MFKVEENRTIYLDDKGNILGEVDYPYISSNVVDVNHTYVDISLRGQGIANLLLTYAFNYFRENNIKVKCSCSYAIKWINNHKEYSDLIIDLVNVS